MDLIYFKFYLKKKLVNYKKLDLNKKANRFDLISKFISKGDVIQVTNSLINSIYCFNAKNIHKNKSSNFFISNKQTRIFLSSFVSSNHIKVLTNC